MNGNEIRKGAAEAVRQYVTAAGGSYSKECDETVKNISSQGGTPLVVAKNHRILGVIHLKDIVKKGVKERFAGSLQNGPSDHYDYRRQPLDGSGHCGRGRCR